MYTSPIVIVHSCKIPDHFRKHQPVDTHFDTTMNTKNTDQREDDKFVRTLKHSSSHNGDKDVVRVEASEPQNGFHLTSHRVGVFEIMP